MLRPHLAVDDFKKVLALEPRNQSVKAQLEATQKLIKKIAFEKVCVSRGGLFLFTPLLSYRHVFDA